MILSSRPLIFTQQAEGDGSGFMKKPSIAICPGLKKKYFAILKENRIPELFVRFIQHCDKNYALILIFKLRILRAY